ncbi:hypothetical protein TNCV_2820571 [Trichonephila clavipes]|nr:hypothetical protein TNCV_2820571 [Trichonephila clavipes]
MSGNRFSGMMNLGSISTSRMAESYVRRTPFGENALCLQLNLAEVELWSRDVSREFSRRNKSDNWDLKALLEFLGEEIQSRERAQSFHSSVREKQNSNNSKQECNSFAFGLITVGLITEMLMLNIKAIIPQQPSS